jgi:hypothetical protein
MRLSHDSWLAIGLVALLSVITVAAAYQQNKSQTIPYLATSAAPDGTLALKLWLTDLGYSPLEEAQSVFEPPQDVKLILVLEPLLTISDNEWKSLDQWVENGGTLILAGDGMPSLYAFDHFKFSLKYLDVQADSLSAAAPILLSPPQTDLAPVASDLYFSSTQTDFVPLLAANGHPIVVSFEKGKGRVILSTTAYPFSNKGLKQDATATLALNLVSLSAQKGRVWFDDWHHGIQSAAIVGPEQWLRRTPAGHALLFVFATIFLALILQGRGFGRPIPLQHEIKRRGPLEHVTAVANLNRKAGHRADVLRQYHQWVKRHLGGRYRLDPSLPDTEYVAQLAKYNPALEKEKLISLLQRLAHPNVSEAEMVKLAEEASKWISE